jgi:hypothetical protein
MVARAIERTRKEQGDNLHAVQILEGKFEIFCKSQYGIKFIFTPKGQNHEQPEAVARKSSSPRSKDQPIQIENEKE